MTRARLGAGIMVVTLMATGASGTGDQPPPPSAAMGDSTGPGWPDGFTPGSRGVGDPYFPLEGNGGFDITHYDLTLTYLPATHHLGGTVTIRARATQNLSRFDLDLKGYQVSSVTVDGASARFTRQGPELVVAAPAGLVKGSRFTVQVVYGGVPVTIVVSPIVFGSPYGWVFTKDGAFVGCAPNAARTWFPSSDHPSDKASFSFAITVPRGYEVVANGEPAPEPATGPMRTFVWTERQPMATYLATIDIGRWDISSTRTAAGIPKVVAVDPTVADRARKARILELTARITDYWQKVFGRYPFRSTGAIVDDVPKVGFALETQSRPLYGFVPSPGTVAHELAHQWFGDSVSVQTWEDVWLNEGFAVFANWLWTEHTTGKSTYQTAKLFYRLFPAGDDLWKTHVADPGRDTLFSRAVYFRGGMTLAALRHKIGDRAFFSLLRIWAGHHRYGNVTTRQFIDLASRLSGQDLSGFFRTWLEKPVKPPSL